MALASTEPHAVEADDSTPRANSDHGIKSKKE